MSSEPFSIRAATVDDATAIMPMVDEFRAYLRNLGDEHSLVNFGLEQYCRDGFGANPAFWGLIAERSGSPLGYLLYTHGYDTDRGVREVFIRDLFVRQSCRGQGVGQELFSRAAQICKASGGHSMVWYVWPANREALHFYEKLGARYTEHLHIMNLHVD
jgi:ribosomal protein S18 acetylase RimI-like enzyme